MEAEPGLAADARPTDASLVTHVRVDLAAYKSPKRIVWVDSIGRAANGKVDYLRLRETAMSQLGIER